MKWELFKKQNIGKWFCECPNCRIKGDCKETEIAIKKHHKWKGIPKYKQGHYTSVYVQTKDIKGKNSNGWKGGRKIDKDGYVLVYAPDHPNARKNGYVLEHRMIMAEQLGRALTSKEVVHHERGKQNPDPKHLKVFGSNGEHLRIELSEKRNDGEPYKNKDFLQREYLDKNRSLHDIGKQFNVSVQAVHRFVKKFELVKPKGKIDEARTNYIIAAYRRKVK